MRNASPKPKLAQCKPGDHVVLIGAAASDEVFIVVGHKDQYVLLERKKAKSKSLIGFDVAASRCHECALE